MRFAQLLPWVRQGPHSDWCCVRRMLAVTASSPGFTILNLPARLRVLVRPKPRLKLSVWAQNAGRCWQEQPQHQQQGLQNLGGTTEERDGAHKSKRPPLFLHFFDGTEAAERSPGNLEPDAEAGDGAGMRDLECGVEAAAGSNLDTKDGGAVDIGEISEVWESDGTGNHGEEERWLAAIAAGGWELGRPDTKEEQEEEEEYYIVKKQQVEATRGLLTGRKVFMSGRLNWAKYLTDEDEQLGAQPWVAPHVAMEANETLQGSTNPRTRETGPPVPLASAFLQSWEFWEYEASRHGDEKAMMLSSSRSSAEQPLEGAMSTGLEVPRDGESAAAAAAYNNNGKKKKKKQKLGRRKEVVKPKVDRYAVLMKMIDPANDDDYLDGAYPSQRSGMPSECTSSILADGELPAEGWSEKDFLPDGIRSDRLLFDDEVATVKERQEVEGEGSQKGSRPRENRAAESFKDPLQQNHEAMYDLELDIDTHGALTSGETLGTQNQNLVMGGNLSCASDGGVESSDDVYSWRMQGQDDRGVSLGHDHSKTTDMLDMDAASALYDPLIIEDDCSISPGGSDDRFPEFSDIWSGSDDDDEDEDEDEYEGDDEPFSDGSSQEMATEADESQDLLKKFLRSRAGDRNSSVEGRVYKFNKKASGKLYTSPRMPQVLVMADHSVARDPGLQLAKPFVRGNEFLYPAPRSQEGSRLLQSGANPMRTGPAAHEDAGIAATNQKEDPEFTSAMREVLQIAYNLPRNHVVEDYMAPFANAFSTLQANLILEALGEETPIHQVMSFFRWMRLHEPCLWDPRSFSLLFILLGKVGMADEALTYFQMLPPEPRFHSVQVYNTLITALTNCDRHSEIFPLLEQMQRWGTEPDSVTFSILMMSARKGEQSLKEVWALYQGMVGRGVRPDVTVFGSLIKAFCDAGSQKEALLVTTEMERHGVPLNAVIYNILIDAYGKAGQMEEAEGLAAEMKEKGLEPNVATYNALIHGYGKCRQLKVAEALVEEMEAAGLKPDVVTFTLLIGAYGQAQRSEQAAQVFHRMQARGIAPNSRSYTALIHAYAEGRWHEKAAKAFEAMQKHGVSPTVETFTALLDGYRRAGDVEMVKAVWKAMKAEGCTATRVTYMTILDAFAKHGRLKEARDLMEEFKNLGHLPDLLVYNMLLNAYTRGGRHQKTPEILKEMKAAGFEPDSFTYCTLIYAFLRVRDFTKGLKYHREMLGVGKAPDPKTYAKLRAILKAVEQRIEENNRKANLGQPQRQRRRPEVVGKDTEKAKAFWKGKKRPSRRLIK